MRGCSASAFSCRSSSRSCARADLRAHGRWPGLRRLLLARQARHDGSINDYIKGTAEKIDEDARKAGVFEEVVTVTPSQMGTSAAITDWTHLRIFKLKNRAAAEALGKGLDAATFASCLTRTSVNATANDRRRCATSFARKSGPRSDRTSS